MPGSVSEPLRASRIWPKSVRSAGRNGAGESAVRDSADGTRSTFSTSCPCSSRSRTTARPAFPLPPVTAILAIGGSCPRGTRHASVSERTSFSAEHTMTALAELPILASSLDALVRGRGIVRVRAGLTAVVIVVLAAAGAGSQAAATSTTHHAATPAALGPDATPREVRARFEQLLGQHALLAVRQARSEVAMAPDLKTVVDSSLAANA